MQTSIHRRQFVQSLVAGSAALAGSQVWASDFPSRLIIIAKARAGWLRHAFARRRGAQSVWSRAQRAS